ncbi:PTS sugar transporter subunit IIA [Roseomonas sp. BN140053]|uniref:PTS sugar transporter subunit IIA n=1 Tax=Roseomonas sp. BN140053 TaxID=3391898 RepID=UPI0039E7BC17
MIGMVLVTHGALAEELRLAMEHVVGPQKHVSALCIGPEDDMETRRAELRARVAEARQGSDGVVVLTDMFGGSPANLAISMLDEGDVEVIAGVNLPLLVKLARLRGTEPMAEAVAHAVAAGRKYLGTVADLRSGPYAGTAKPAAPGGQS